MKSDDNSSARALVAAADPPDLFAQTLRTVAILVGACVLFVGALSGAAVFLASKALGPTEPTSSAAEPPFAPAKKPLSI